MFISRKRWNEMERRVAALEKNNNSKTISLERVKEAMESALGDAKYRFEYELTENLELAPSLPFSTNPKSSRSTQK